MSADNQARMQRRNVELGRMLQTARVNRKASISECAALIGTGRPRYRDIESGESYVTAVELEMLMEFLQIPYDLTGSVGRGGERRILRLPITVAPDDTIYLVVDVTQSTG
jgi:transcriptional regulator with XRE-family HTH domain